MSYPSTKPASNYPESFPSGASSSIEMSDRSSKASAKGGLMLDTSGQKRSDKMEENVPGAQEGKAEAATGFAIGSNANYLNSHTSTGKGGVGFGMKGKQVIVPAQKPSGQSSASSSKGFNKQYVYKQM